MKTKHLLGIPLLFLCATSFFACSDDDDDNKEPEGSVTLNIMNEENGKTLLGVSDVYINKANNFKTSDCFIAYSGESNGLGTSIPPQLNNLSQEVAVIPKYLYYIYDKNTILEFPSGNKAIPIGSNYYKMYVVDQIISEDKTIGATIKYTSIQALDKKLPNYGEEIGPREEEGTLRCSLPKDCEIYTSNKDITVEYKNKKLHINIRRYNDRKCDLFIRSGTVYTYVYFLI